MIQTIGVFAHVDAGKTTFCESLLYQTKQLAAPGRVDHQNAFLDHDLIERRHGITIFSDVASFTHDGHLFYLIDTPGHVDFSAEMERVISILDAAVLVISAPDMVQSHTLTVFRLLRAAHVPIFIFINKMDQPGVDLAACIADIQDKLTDAFYCLNPQSGGLQAPEFIEWLCERDDGLLQCYIEDQMTAQDIRAALTAAGCIRQEIVIGVSGSALSHLSVMDLLDLMAFMLPAAPVQEQFAARVFKVIYDAKGNKVAFIKCLSGRLQVKAEVAYNDGRVDKVHELRAYQGRNYTPCTELRQGEIAGVTGLSFAKAGMGLGACEDLPEPILQPALKAAVLRNQHSYDEVMVCLKKLEEQDPLLHVSYKPEIAQIDVCVMGKVQLEVLKELIANRYAIDIAFGQCRIVYRETLRRPIMGYGHYEPLRHYAEVHLRMQPNPNGGRTFASELHTDILAKQHQNLIRQFVLELDHKGVLTGSSLEDIHFVLTKAAIHLKHTHGGDLREAVCRAIRQGMEKAEAVLLEPYYHLTIDAPNQIAGRVLTDITKLQGSFSPPEVGQRYTRISGIGPVRCFLSYPEDLLSYSKGTCSISMAFSGYQPCRDADRIVAELGYEKDRDLINVSSSIFCAKGAGFEVKWQDAEKYMHLI